MLDLKLEEFEKVQQCSLWFCFQWHESFRTSRMKKSSLGLAALDRVRVPDMRTEESIGKVKDHSVAVFNPRYRVCQEHW